MIDSFSQFVRKSNTLLFNFDKQQLEIQLHDQTVNKNILMIK